MKANRAGNAVCPDLVGLVIMISNEKFNHTFFH